MKTLIKTLILLALPACAAVLLVFASNRLDSGSAGENMKQLEASIRKAVMTCYSTEGVYPPSVQYMRDNYGIQIDDAKYTVFYEIFGENIMPQITIMEKDPEPEE